MGNKVTWEELLAPLVSDCICPECELTNSKISACIKTLRKAEEEGTVAINLPDEKEILSYMCNCKGVEENCMIKGLKCEKYFVYYPKVTAISDRLRKGKV